MHTQSVPQQHQIAADTLEQIAREQVTARETKPYCDVLVLFSTVEFLFLFLPASVGLIVLARRFGGATAAIEGFDLGNDPREYTRARVGGRVVVFTTSNGTRAIRRCAAAGHVLVGCLWNLEACAVVAARLAGQVHIVCAGVGGRVAGEDVIAAGALAERVSAVGGMELDDSARMAVEWWRAARGDLAGAMRACVGGRNLERIGMGEQIEVCARVNVAEMVPRMTDGGMVMGERASGV